MKTNQQSNYIYSNSLFSSQELKIDSEDNLKISTFSLLKNENKKISLDLIDSDIKVSKHPDLFIALIAVVCLVASASLYLTATNIGLFSGQMLAATLFGLSIVLFAISLKTPTKTFKFYYKNTPVCVFKLKSSHSNIHLINEFAEQLTQCIIKPQVEDVEDSIDTEAEENLSLEKEFRDHLDFLYNYGMVNDVIYERIDSNISEVIYGKKPSQQMLAEVIPLPLRSV